MLHLDKILFKKSHFFFIGFFLLMLAGFWVSYFTELGNQENYRMHFHGIVMICWCVMLVLQAFLISKKRKTIHRNIGWASYLLVPLIAYSTIDLYKYRLSQQETLSVRDYLFTASVLIALLFFLVFYGLAILYRKRPLIHARFMVCTVFPMFTAVFDRIIDSFLPQLQRYFPDVQGPVNQVVGLVAGDIILLLFSLWDGISNKKWAVFPLALSIHLAYHYAVLNFYRFEFWQRFSEWFFRL